MKSTSFVINLEEVEPENTLLESNKFINKFTAQYPFMNQNSDKSFLQMKMDNLIDNKKNTFPSTFNKAFSPLKTNSEKLLQLDSINRMNHSKEEELVHFNSPCKSLKTVRMQCLNTLDNMNKVEKNNY